MTNKQGQTVHKTAIEKQTDIETKIHRDKQASRQTDAYNKRKPKTQTI